MKITKFDCLEVNCCYDCPYRCTDIYGSKCEISNEYLYIDIFKTVDFNCPYTKEYEKEVWHKIVGKMLDR